MVRRFAESMAAPLWLFALLFIPIALGAHDLYHWTHTDAVASDEVLRHKAPYLNQTFFFIRAVIYLAAWSFLGHWFFKKSTLQDRTGHQQLTRQMQYASGACLAVFAFTITFAAIDWIMSLEPHWFSTMFGVYYFSGSLVGIFALLVLLAMRARKAELTAGVITVEHFHDLGKLLFAFTVFWAYIAFSQYMLIWYANLPEETAWYAERWKGSWQSISVLIGVGHFCVPFFYLMGRDVKRTRAPLLLGAVWMLLIHFIDIHWLVMPTHHREGFHLTALDISTLVGVGGIYLFLVTRLWQSVPLIPVKDPRLAESVGFENF